MENINERVRAINPPVSGMELLMKKMTFDLVAVDTETYYDPNNKDAVTRFIQGTPNNVPFCVSMSTRDIDFFFDLPQCREQVRMILENAAIPKIFHNSKYDMLMFRNIGIDTHGTVWDTMLMQHLINEEHECKLPGGGKKKTKALKPLAFHYFDEEDTSQQRIKAVLKEIRSEDNPHPSYKDVYEADPEAMREYAMQDTWITYRLYHKLIDELHLQMLMKAYEVDIQATRVVIDMEIAGFPVDYELMKHKGQLLTELIDKLHHRAFVLAGRDINLNAEQEVVDFAEERGFQWKYFTEKGELSVDKHVVKKVMRETTDPVLIELLEILLEYRTANKMLTTYITGVFPFIQDGRVHADFWINPDDHSSGGTVTGRLSSSNPNLHNQPKGNVTVGGVDVHVREFFIPARGHVLLFADAKQEEYRLLGHYGKDEAFKAMIDQGYDIHTGTASMLFGKPYEEVSKDERQVGKTTNFGLVYGLGLANFAAALGKPVENLDLRAAQDFLYKIYMPWEIPPHGSKVTLEMALSNLPADHPQFHEINESIRYMFSHDVQQALREAKEIKNHYFKRFPGIQTFLKEAQNVAKKRRWVMTWTGRRRHFTARFANDAYKAPNAIIQGGCGDILKAKMVEVHRFLLPCRSYLVNNVHDELCIMLHLSELHIIQPLHKLLEKNIFRVPIEWDMEWSDASWGEKKPMEELYEKYGTYQASTGAD